MTCPSCKRDVEATAIDCPWCGVVLSKARERLDADHGNGPPTPTIWVESPPPPEESAWGRIVFVLIVLAAVGWWIVKKATYDPYYGRAPRAIETFSMVVTEDSDFDIRGILPFPPNTAAWNGLQMFVANRDPDGGVGLLTPDGASAFHGDWIPIVAPETGEDLILRAATWNGETWIGYAEGHWFDRDGWVFTIHDRNTLAVSRIVPAPPLLGCLTWDGSRYWAATRKTSKYAEEDVFLYTIDQEFKIQKKSEPPAWGCQGLAWDGALLWMADSFDGAVHLINVGGERVVTSYPTGFSDIGGLVWDDRNIWVLDAKGKKILRLNPRLRSLWTSSSAGTGLAPSDPVAVDMLELDLLRTQLRSDDEAERNRATNRLRILGLPVPYARVESVGSEDQVLLKSLVVEARGALVEATWHATFSAQFLGSQDGCCTYSLSISGGALPRPVVKLYEARTGDNIERGILLARELGPGEYWIEFVVQGASGLVSPQLARLRIDL